jgi:hypothetical protein
MAKSKSGGSAPSKKSDNSERPNGKANKKNPKQFDPIKRRLVSRKA